MTDQIDTNPALTKLTNVTGDITIPDMNYLFHYSRVKKPDNNMSHLFTLHYKESQQENWETSRNLLSQQFVVAKTELILNQIQQNLGGTIVSQNHYRSNTSVKAIFTLSGFSIDIPEESDVDLVIFKLITNITADISLLTSHNLMFSVINGFSGNHALSLNYGLLKTMTSRIGNDDRIIPINNIFILDKFTKRLIHDNRMSINIEDVVNVQRSIQEQVLTFKRLPFGENLVENMCDKLPKKFSKKFGVLYDSLPEELRNFYYVSYIWSVLLDIERKIDLEIKVRTMMNVAIENLLRAERG